MRRFRSHGIHGFGAFLVFAGVVLSAGAQTLGDELRRAEIPAAHFSSDELGETVNATTARKATLIYMAYMRVAADNLLTGHPQVVRYDSATGIITRKELSVGDEVMCCGSPLSITVTHSYEFFEFHYNPSASTVLAADKDLELTAVLYGFGTWEITPDEVVYTENMMHFAPSHAERLRILDLRSGATEQIYPPKDDPLRAQFARLHKRKMPSQTICQTENDACDPTSYDETIAFESANAGQLKFRVARDAVHILAKDQEPSAIVSQAALYIYERKGAGWRYCEVPLRGRDLAHEGCVPNLPVTADENAEGAWPPPLLVRKEK